MLQTIFLQPLESRTLLSAYYSVEDLGSLGGQGADAYDINNLGQVVGDSLDENSHLHGFLWNPSGGICSPASMVPIDVPGSSDTYAASINDDGVIIGTTSLDNDPKRLYRSFRYTNGNIEFLAMKGDHHNLAISINNRGQILTTRTIPNSSDNDVILYDSSIKDYTYVARDFPYGMNDFGQITVTSGPDGKHYINPKFEHHLFAGTGINNSSTVVWGDASAKPNTINIQNGKRITRLAADDSRWNFGSDIHINNPGVMVGWAWRSGDETDTNWIRDGNVLRDLNTLLPADLGFKIDAVQGINDRGQLIASAQIDGQGHAFILTPTGAPFPGELGPTDIQLKKLPPIESAAKNQATASKKRHLARAKRHHRHPHSHSSQDDASARSDSHAPRRNVLWRPTT